MVGAVVVMEVVVVVVMVVVVVETVVVAPILVRTLNINVVTKLVLKISLSEYPPIVTVSDCLSSMQD